MNPGLAAFRTTRRLWPVPALLLAVAAVPAIGEQPPAFPDVPPQATLCAIVRFGDFYRSPAGQATLKNLNEAAPKAVPGIEKLLGFPVSQIEVVTAVVTTADERGPETAVIIFDLNKPVKPADLLAALSQGEQNRDGLPAGVYRLKGRASATMSIANERRFTIFTNDRARSEYVELLLRRGPGALDEALALAARKPVAVLGFRTADLADQRPDARNQGPQQRAIRPLTETKLLTAQAVLDGTLKLDVRLDFADKGEAAQAEKALVALRTLLSFELGLDIQRAKDKKDRLQQEALEATQTMFKGATFRREGARLFVQAELAPEGPVAALAQSLARELSPSGDASLQNQLRQIGIALHNYHDVYGHFPPAAICDKAGKPLLSWRVAILPFLEGADLYQQFRLNEPWDSAHNKKLLAKMPNVFRAPAGARGVTPDSRTPFRVFFGNGALFELRKGTTITEVTDGTSNTLMVGVAAEAVPWTKPEELPFDPKKPLPALARTETAGPWVLFADGSARQLPAKVKPETLRALITRAGGEVISLDE